MVNIASWCRNIQRAGLIERHLSFVGSCYRQPSKKPVAVRYLFKEWFVGELSNKEGLPVLSEQMNVKRGGLLVCYEHQVPVHASTT